MKVAIVHDWLVGGGAERVVVELHKMYPEAPIYTSYCTDEWRAKLDGKVVTGFLQYWPFPALRKFVPFLRIWWFSRLKFDNFDLVISSSGAEAKGIKVRRGNTESVRNVQLAVAQGAGEDRKGNVQSGTLTADRSSQHGDAAKSANGTAGFAGRQVGAVHISYCHAPTHYYWSRYDEYLKNPGFGFFDPLARLGLRLLVGPLRKWDYKAAQRPDFMIANSSYTKKKIKEYYDRDAVVIHPPVDIERFAGAAEEPRRGFVTAGRQTPYKRIDLAVAACTKLELPLVVIGKGPDHKKLKKMAGKSVTFLRGKNDEEVAHYFKSSQAFIFPGLDDFGISAVEALAAGTPVIAYGVGGALDYVTAQTGILFSEQSRECLSKSLANFPDKKFNPKTIAAAASKFSPQVFQSKFSSFVKDCLAR